MCLLDKYSIMKYELVLIRSLIYVTILPFNRYLQLLNKAKPDEPALMPLVPVFSLLVAPSVAPSVVETILSLTEELLDQSENEEISEGHNMHHRL